MSHADQYPPKEEWEHLTPFGFAYGDYYHANKGCCGGTFFNLDKRASRCRECAQKAYDAEQQAQIAHERSKEIWAGVLPLYHEKLAASLATINEIITDAHREGIPLELNSHPDATTGAPYYTLGLDAERKK